MVQALDFYQITAQSRSRKHVNVFLLSASKYVSQLWLTLRHANELRGQVRKGEESSIVTFWKVEDAKQRSTSTLRNRKRKRPGDFC